MSEHSPTRFLTLPQIRVDHLEHLVGNRDDNSLPNVRKASIQQDISCVRPLKSFAGGLQPSDKRLGHARTHAFRELGDGRRIGLPLLDEVAEDVVVPDWVNREAALPRNGRESLVLAVDLSQLLVDGLDPRFVKDPHAVDNKESCDHSRLLTLSLTIDGHGASISGGRSPEPASTCEACPQSYNAGVFRQQISGADGASAGAPSRSDLHAIAPCSILEGSMSTMCWNNHWPSV